MADLARRVQDLERLVDVQGRQIFGLRKQMKEQQAWLDTIASPPWKKLWWLLKGYRWYVVGRWRP